MDLRPFNVKNHRVKKLSISAATVASNSATAPGTGLMFVPVYFWCSGSGLGSVSVLAGSAGTAYFSVKTPIAGIVEGRYWQDEGVLANKPLVIESTLNGIGVHEFHVWYVVRRIGAGDAGATL